MKAQICFQIPGGQICIPIPLLYQSPWKPIPDPGPWRPDPNPWRPDPDPWRPEPNPWIFGLEISREMIRDLSVIATVHELVNELKTPVMREHLSKALQRATEELKLPEGVHVKLDQQVAA
jgi:hypothetical protein